MREQKNRVTLIKDDGVVTVYRWFDKPENEALRSSIKLPPYRRSFDALANVPNRLQCSEKEGKVFDAFDAWRFEYVKSAMMKYSYRDLTSEALTLSAIRKMKQYLTQAGEDGESFERAARAAWVERGEKAFGGYPALVTMAMNAAGERAGVQVKKGGLIACALAGMEALGGRWTMHSSFDFPSDDDNSSSVSVFSPDLSQRNVISEGEFVNSLLIPYGVVYIQIDSFTEGSAAEFKQAIREALKGGTMRGVVIDVRGNPGGNDQEMNDILMMIVGYGKNTGYDDCFGGYRKSVFSQKEDLLVSVPIAVLVDGSSVSAAENLAASLKEQKRAFLVGFRTFGKGSGCHHEEFDPLFNFSVTSALFYPPSGSVIEGYGVDPDVWPGQANPERDVTLEVALRELNVRMAKHEQAEQIIKRIVKHDELLETLINQYNETLFNPELHNDEANAREELRLSKLMTRAMLFDRSPANRTRAEKDFPFSQITVSDCTIGKLKAFLAEGDRIRRYTTQTEALETQQAERAVRVAAAQAASSGRVVELAAYLMDQGRLDAAEEVGRAELPVNRSTELLEHVQRCLERYRERTVIRSLRVPQSAAYVKGCAVDGLMSRLNVDWRWAAALAGFYQAKRGERRVIDPEALIVGKGRGEVVSVLLEDDHFSLAAALRRGVHAPGAGAVPNQFVRQGCVVLLAEALLRGEQERAARRSEAMIPPGVTQAGRALMHTATLGVSAVISCLTKARQCAKLQASLAAAMGAETSASPQGGGETGIRASSTRRIFGEAVRGADPAGMGGTLSFNSVRHAGKALSDRKRFYQAALWTADRQGFAIR